MQFKKKKPEKKRKLTVRSAISHKQLPFVF
jgi:hypothetical protein